jgi:hypothetical protein
MEHRNQDTVFKWLRANEQATFSAVRAAQTKAREQSRNERVYGWARLPDFEDFRMKRVPRLGPASIVLEISADPRNARFGLETRESKETKETKESKETKETKESKESRDSKDSEWKFSVRYHDLAKSTPGTERIFTLTFAGHGGASPSTSPSSNSTVATSCMFPGVQITSVPKASGAASITPIGTVLARSDLFELRVAPNPADHKPEQVVVFGITAASSASFAVSSTSDRRELPGNVSTITEESTHAKVVSASEANANPTKPVVIPGRGSSEDMD